MKLTKLILAATVLSISICTPAFAGTAAGNGDSESTQAAALSVEDFVVSGDNSTTRGTADHSIITEWQQLDGEILYHSFVTGDSVETARGISFQNTKGDVFAKYGNAEVQNFDAGTDYLYLSIVADQGSDAQTFINSATYVEYTNQEYGLRFYFNSADTMIGIIYFKNEGNKTATQQQLDAALQMNAKDGDLSEEEYWYYETILYAWNDTSHAFEQIGKTARKKTIDGLLDERFKLGQVADPVLCMSITDAEEDCFEVGRDGDMDYKIQYIKDGDKWVCDEDSDGLLSDEEKGYGADEYMVVDDDESLSFISIYVDLKRNGYLPEAAVGKTVMVKQRYKNTISGYSH